MPDSYVCSGAMMRCTMGTSPAQLTVLPSRTVFLCGQPMANISDHKSMVNLAPFGLCRSLGFPATASATAAHHGVLTPMPCVHNTPAPWMPGKTDYFIQNQPALLKTCKCTCMWGGVISLVTDGQVGEGTQYVNKNGKASADDIQAESNKSNTPSAESVLDGIQLALDIAGFAPGVGAVPDLLNAAISALRGNWAEAGLSVLAAVPLIGDAAAGAKMASKGLKIAKDVNIARKVVLAKEAKKYISKEITKKELLKSGICKSEKEVVFFQKALRGERKDFATNFYRKNGMTEKRDIANHVNGIDLNHAVKVKEMPPPNELIRFNEPGMEKKGNYFGVSSRTDGRINTPRSYGTQPVVVKNEDGLVKVIRKKKTVYNISDSTEPFEYLESTAKPIKAPLNNDWNSPKNLDSGIINKKSGIMRKNWTDTKGGALQAYVPPKFRGNIRP